jgi:D-alanine-D-alanine ligase
MSTQNIALIFGGKSSEHEVSIRSARTIYKGLQGEGFNVYAFGIARDGKWLTQELSSAILRNTDILRAESSKGGSAISEFINLALSENSAEAIHACFPIVHGTLGEDGALQGLFRVLNVPYVGPDVLSSALCMDKDVAKRLLSAAGIPNAPYECIEAHQLNKVDISSLIQKLGLPLFVKPANQGSSVGVSKVTEKGMLLGALRYASEFDKKIIVESCIRGREIECSVMGNEDPIASVPGEIVPKADFYSYDAKYSVSSSSETRIPAALSGELIEQIKNMAVSCFKVLQCEGMARVDFFVEDTGRILVNEINTLPGFTSISMYPKMWESSGVALAKLLRELVNLAIKRSEREGKLKLSPN